MIYLRKTIFNFLVIAVILGLIFGNTADKSAFKHLKRLVIIDAGHGLPDGGAVATDGTIESELNLIIAKAVYTKLTDAGINCILTRKDENSIFTEGNTIHSKKVSDIKNRVNIASENPDALVISIHMNTYPDPNVSGTQVFYKLTSSISKDIATELQNAVNINFQNNNVKKIKPIPKNVYFFKNISNDAILIECGFLTNKYDLERLKSFEFQQSFSSITSEVIAYKLTGSENNAN